MDRIGLIGTGNMGYALLKGMLRHFNQSELVITDADPEKRHTVSRETGVEEVSSNAECVRLSKYVILAVKPQYYPEVLDGIADYVEKSHVLISIAPGISISDIVDRVGFDTRVVRAMPNTPALVGAGMTGVAYDKNLFTVEERDVIGRVFTSVGKMKIVDEKMMNAVVCASGSSPAYVFMMIEALADGAVRCGMSRADAYEFVAQAVLGSAEMVLKTQAHPGVLKDMVCSPAGTTIDAVKVLEDCGFRSALMNAAQACFEKCEKVAK